MIPIEWIMEAGCKATGVTAKLIRSRYRNRPLVARRRFIARKMREAGYSYPKIGKALGGRDHSTVMHYLRSDKQ